MLVVILLLLCANNINSSKTSNYICPKSGAWMLKGKKCYKWGPSPKTFTSAREFCQSENAKIQVPENEEENNLFIEQDSSAKYWLGLSPDNENRRNTKFSKWRNYYGYSRGECSIWESDTGYWETTSCSNVRLFLCEKNAECEAGYFGWNCSKSCHCYGETCNLIFGTCNYGCQDGWMGKSCEMRKVPVTALYYCLNSRDRGKALIIRADQHGINYRNVVALDKSDNPVQTCNKSTFSFVNKQLHLTINSPINSSDFEPECGAEHISANIYKWKFLFAEFSGTESVYDVIFEMTCDFDKADSLRTESSTDNKRYKMRRKQLKRTTVQAELAVEDPFTGKLLKKVKANHNVRLVIRLTATNQSAMKKKRKEKKGKEKKRKKKRNREKNLDVKAISLYNCLVGTEDGAHKLVILDEKGCNTKNSDIVFTERNGTVILSSPFRTFTFSGYTKLVFSCRFDICFSAEDRLCEDRCNLFRESFLNEALHPSFKYIQNKPKASLELV